MGEVFYSLSEKSQPFMSIRHQLPQGALCDDLCLFFISLLPLQGEGTLLHLIFATSNATASLPQLWYPPKNSQAVSAAWVTPQLSPEGGHSLVL